MFWILPVAIIAGREFVISVYRTFVGVEGRQHPGQPDREMEDGLFQQLAVGFALWPWFAVDVKWLWVTSALDRSRAGRCSAALQYLWYARVTETGPR